MIGTATVTGGALNVRAATSVSSTKLGSLPEGTTVDIVEKTSSEWWKIQYGALIGYVKCAFLVESSGNITLSLDKTTAETLYSALGKALGVSN